MRATAAEHAGGEHAFYVYGIVGTHAAPPPHAAGVDPRFPVEVVRAGELGVLASAVEAAEFEEGRLEENVSDPRWLEACVRAHETVLELALERGPVVPLRFGTIHRSREALGARVAADAERLTALLARLAGRREWGVKCHVDDRVLTNWVLAHDERARELSAEVARRSEGSAFFARKHLERHLRDCSQRVAEEAARAAYTRLGAVAEAATIGAPALAPEREGARLLLNASYLVERRAEGRLRELVAELGGEYEPLGLTFALTGPWPPYAFVAEREEA